MLPHQEKCLFQLSLSFPDKFRYDFKDEFNDNLCRLLKDMKVVNNYAEAGLIVNDYTIIAVH